MTSPRYRIIVNPLPEDEGSGYVAFAPDLPGCMGDGDTPQEALADCLSAIEEWTDEALRHGRGIPTPGPVRAGSSVAWANWADIATRLANARAKLAQAKADYAERWGHPPP